VPATFYVTISQAEFERLRAKDIETELNPFVRRLGDNILTVLAATPRKFWPRVANISFNHAAQEMPTLAAMYTKNHDAIHAEKRG